MRWILPQPLDPTLTEGLARDLGVPSFVVRLLLARGARSRAECEHFLRPMLKSLADPFLLPDMDLAVNRIFQAVDARERIVLYGDYDVDGVTSLTVLARTLKAYGADVACFLPHRRDEGYGLSQEGVARCVATHRPQLLIAVDCGSSSIAEIAALACQGIDVVVLDHHEMKSGVPRCAAVVNPKRGETFNHLCSAGLAFKTAHALLKKRMLPDFDLREYLDLVALGTVADLVPLSDENRALVKRGLEQLQHTKWPGLKALIEVSQIAPPFTPSTLSFALGPRLNAAGRLGTAQDALDLLMADSLEVALPIAKALDVQNRERRSVEEDVYRLAEAQLATWFDPSRHSAIVVGAEGWHAGVVGIVASRLQRRHHRPTLVIGFDQNGRGKGSGRSIEGLSLVSALSRCGGLLDTFGGHEMAAGLTVQLPNFEAFKDAFLGTAAEMLSPEQLQPRMEVDAELPLREVNFGLLRLHDALQPFGMGNRQPTFYTRGVTLAAEPKTMKEKHLSLILRQADRQFRALWFHGAHESLPNPPWDVAFDIERSEWQGLVTAQIHVKAIRPAADKG